MNVLIAASTGRYTEIGNPQDADCVVGQSFGVGEYGPGYVNELLAQYIVRNTVDIPMLLQSEVALALPEDSQEPALVIAGNPSTATGGELDSWTVLSQANTYMREHGLCRPLLVAQAFHVGRLALQAKKLEMNVIVPGGLPREFDPDSLQPWTRSKRAWLKREIPGIAYLKFISHKL